MWPAEGPKISIVKWPAKLRSAARVTRGPHLCCGPRAACCGPRAALKNERSRSPLPEKGCFIEGGVNLSRGGVNLEREKFSICTPPPGREFRTKGKKRLFAVATERSRGCDAACGPPGFWDPKCGPRPKKS